MAIALVTIQGLLGLLFIITGSFKFFQSREKVIASGGTWAEDFKPTTIKTIAALELISGLLLILPLFIGLGFYPPFIGAATIAIIMLGSIYVHFSRKEFKHAAINAVFLLMALFVVYCTRPVFN